MAEEKSAAEKKKERDKLLTGGFFALFLLAGLAAIAAYLASRSASGGGTTCPAGQHWDGTKCVPDGGGGKIETMLINVNFLPQPLDCTMTVTGVLVEKISGNPLPSKTARLWATREAITLSAVTTDYTGSFVMQNVNVRNIFAVQVIAAEGDAAYLPAYSNVMAGPCGPGGLALSNPHYLPQSGYQNYLYQRYGR